MGTVENTLPVEQDLRTKAQALVLKKTVRSLGGETSEGACLTTPASWRTTRA